MVAVNTQGLFLLIARVVMAGVFIQAGLPKIQDPVSFAGSIEGYRIISGTAVLWVAVILPWLELIIGIGLLTPWLKRASALMMAGLLALFIILHTSAWARGLDIECGCFGESADSIDYHWLILRNLIFLGTLIFILRVILRNKRTTKASK